MTKKEAGIYIPQVDLTNIVCQALLEEGFSASDSAECAEHVLRALLHGVFTHEGVKLLHLLGHVLKNCDRRGRWTLETSNYGCERWNGNYQIGIPVALAAVRRATELATELGFGSVFVRNFTHALWCGDYLRYIAMSRGKNGECFWGSYRCTAGFGHEVVPFGGRRGTLGTNPSGEVFSLGDGEDPFLYDGASSAISMGAVSKHQRDGTPVPEGSVLDEFGQPTTDANRAKLLCAMGGYKGSAAGVAVEFQQALMQPGKPELRNREAENGCYFEVHVRAYGLFRGPAMPTLQAQLENLRAVRDAIYRENGEARMPGQSKFEYRRRFEKREDVFLPDSLVKSYRKMAETAGVSIDWSSLPRTADEV